MFPIKAYPSAKKYNCFLIAVFIIATIIAGCKTKNSEQKSDQDVAVPTLNNKVDISQPVEMSGSVESTCGSNRFLFFMYIPKGKKGILQINADQENYCDIIIKRSLRGTDVTSPLAEIRSGEDFIVDFDSEVHGNITLNCKWAEGVSKPCKCSYKVIFF